MTRIGPRRRLAIQIPYLSWRDLAIGVWPLVILTIIAFIVALRFVSPAPPHKLTMVTGPADSTFARVAERYSFSVHGSVLNLLGTDPPLDMTTYGAPANLAYNPAMHQAGAVGRFFNVGATYTF